ncbi:MGAM [Branchiostoma lanceolatum]|uniref:alpha-glucosidase n=1 Tax=Branchiostoma lanceolatum TaxID=7740 RepID=A0A8K0ADF6_BRALA|nr:MGAM [Branchiostoma lanceolatum]
MKKRRRRCAVAAVLLAIIVPTAVVLLRSDRIDPVCPAMDERERVDCHPEVSATRDRCEARGCCWNPAATQGPPSCFYPTNHGYEVDGEVVTTASGYRARLRRLKSPPNPYSGDVETLEVVVEMQEEHRLHLKILDPAEARYEVLKPQILDPAEARYEVPEAALRVPRPGQAVDNPMYDASFTHRPFSIKVTRRSTGATIFDTSVGKLTFSDQFLSVSTRLASSNLYGLGEHVHRRYRHDLNWKTWPIFSRGVRPSGNSDNLYGHQPFYMCLEDSDGNANGVFLLNSNAMEVVLQPPVTSVGRVAMPTVTYRVLGGVLDFYMFLGPSPENVVQQYTEMFGRAIMPAYWALGFQLSRWNYTDTNKLRQVVQRTRDTGTPYDVQYGDIDYMEDRKDFTYDADLYQGLPDLVQNLHDHGQKYVIILDPAIGNTNRRDGSPYLPYESGLQSDIFVKNADGETDLVSKVWPGTTVFPDFTNPTTVQWWGDHCESFHKVIPYDGLWIDMNEPKTLVNGSLTGCADDRWNHPPYLPVISMFGRMYERTLCMDTLQHWGRHYDVHSLYGHSMAIATHSAMRRVFPDKRGIIITRSNFAGTGQYSGHWLGDNKSAWEDMEWSITGSYRANFVGTGQYSEHWLGDNKSAWEDMDWSITGSYRANFVGTGQYSGHWLGDNKSAWEDMEWSITGSYWANFVGTGQYSGHWLGDNKSAWEDMEWSITGSYWANFVGTGQYSGHWLGDNKSAWEDMEWSITGSYWANFVGTGQYSGHWLGDNKSAWEDMEWSITGSYRANFVGTGQYAGHWLGDNKSAWEDLDWSITGSHRANFVGTGQYSGHWLGDNKSAWEDMEWSITGSYWANFVGTGQYSGHWLGDNKSAWEDMEWSITGSYWANFVGTGQYSGHWLGDNKSAWEDMEWSITGSHRANFVGTGQYSGHWLGDNKSAWEDMEWSITGSYRANFVGTGQYAGHWLGDNKSAWEDMDWSITGKVLTGLTSWGRGSTPGTGWGITSPHAGEDMEWSITGKVLTGLTSWGRGSTPGTGWGITSPHAGEDMEWSITGKVLTGLTSWGPDSTPDTGWGITSPHAGEDMEWSITGSYRANFVGTGQYSWHWLGDNKSAWEDMDWSITGKVLTGLTLWGRGSTPGTGWGITSPHAGEDMEWSITGSYRANFVGTGQYSWHWLGDNKSAWEDMDWSITGKVLTGLTLWGRGSTPGTGWGITSPHAGEDMEWSITGSYRANFVGTGQYSGHWLGDNKSAWEDMEWSITGSYRANFVGTGQYAGHWMGDNKSAWEDMEWSITGMLEFGLFGIPYIGADICGFLQDTTEELCQRWMQLGAFYPFARNHNLNSTVEQDPAVFSQSMIDSSRDVMMTRYTLLPYLYTLFYHAHVAGTTVVRPLLHEFPTDSNTWDVDIQFLWGSGLLISPVLTPDTATVDAYFPDTPWYDYFTGHQVEGQYRGQTVTLDAPLNKINVHVRGGTILPTQQPANTTVCSRKNPMGLLVAMDDSSAASGTLFWDDGESIDSVERQDYVFINFKASSTELLCEVVNVPLAIGGPTAGHWADLLYGTVSVYGLALGAGTPTVRAGPFGGPLQTVAASRVQYDRDNQVLLLIDLNDLDLAITSSLRVIWGQR